MATRIHTATPREHVDERKRTAYHEAGHAVLSAAIGNRPVHLTIKSDALTLGSSVARQPAYASSRVQVHLAGFAAEHVLTGRRPRQLDQEIRFSLLARLDRKLMDAFPGSEHRDGHRAVVEILRTAVFDDDDEIRREVDRFYDKARESLAIVWPSVRAIAEALLVHEELDKDGVNAAIGDVDLCGMLSPLQRASGPSQRRGPLERSPIRTRRS